jgi:hypothetical protein
METSTGSAARDPSRARSTELRLFAIYLAQQMRNAPPLFLHELDVDELRRFAKAVDALQEQTRAAIDIAIAHQAARTRVPAA